MESAAGYEKQRGYPLKGEVHINEFYIGGPEEGNPGRSPGKKRLEVHIMNIQGWIRGIHHHCSKAYLQGYLDEYHFRFNRRNTMGAIFNTLIERMMQATPKRLENIQK